GGRHRDAQCNAGKGGFEIGNHEKPRQTSIRRIAYDSSERTLLRFGVIGSATRWIGQQGARMIRGGLIGLGVMFAGSAFAQAPYTAAEMQALLAKGVGGASSDFGGGKVFTARITLAAGGQLSGALTPAGDKAIPVSGTWK